MALTNCKECKREVSTEAKTCPYCGIDDPGFNSSGVNKHNRRVGAFVLGLLIFLSIFIFTGHEKADSPNKENAGARANKNANADVAKAEQETNTVPFSSEQPWLIEAPAKKASTPVQVSSAQTKPLSPVNHDKLEPDKTRSIPSPDTPQILVMRMLDYALNDGGLSHESAIQKTKLQLENLPKPAKGNKKAARAINAKALSLSKQGDINNAVKMFKEANELDKSDIEIVNNLGFSYLKQGNLDLAQQSISLALTMFPDRATAWENLGEVFGVKGDISKSVACFSNAYRFSKDRLKMHQYMKLLEKKEDVKNLKQARAQAINWAEKTYLNFSKTTEPKKPGFSHAVKD